MFWNKKKEEPNPLVGRIYDFRQKGETWLYFAHVTHIYDKLVVYDGYDEGIIADKSKMRSISDFDDRYDTSEPVCLFKNVKEHFEEAATRAKLDEIMNEQNKKIKDLEYELKTLKEKNNV